VFRFNHPETNDFLKPCDKDSFITLQLCPLPEAYLLHPTFFRWTQSQVWVMFSHYIGKYLLLHFRN
jgi:hypothetical protein